jgi:hypothetical protein
MICLFVLAFEHEALTEELGDDSLIAPGYSLIKKALFVFLAGLAHDTPPVNGLDWIGGSGFCACEQKIYVEAWNLTSVW